MQNLLPMPAYLANDDVLRALIASAKDCLGHSDGTAEFIAAAEQELADRQQLMRVVPLVSQFRRAAEAAGWREGGGYIFNSNIFNSWKEAVSWSGDDGRDEREKSSTIYKSWETCCEIEGIEVDQ